MRIAAEQGRVFVPKQPTGIDRSDKEEYMREYKRIQRRKAGARLREDITAATQAKREAIEIKRALKPKLHEAHVKRYLYLLDSRAKYAAKYKANPQAEIDRQSRRKQTDVYKAQQKAYRQKLPDSYVIQSLKSTGIPLDVITQRLIKLKREAMQYGRLSRHTKSTIKNHLKENNETITKHP